MKIHSTLITYSSRPDSAGNSYYAFEFVDHITGKVAKGSVGNSGGNIDFIRNGWTTPGEWDSGIQTSTIELPIRQFNAQTKYLQYAGSQPEEMQKFIREQLKKD